MYKSYFYNNPKWYIISTQPIHSSPASPNPTIYETGTLQLVDSKRGYELR